MGRSKRRGGAGPGSSSASDGERQLGGEVNARQGQKQGHVFPVQAASGPARPVPCTHVYRDKGSGVAMGDGSRQAGSGGMWGQARGGRQGKVGRSLCLGTECCELELLWLKARIYTSPPIAGAGVAPLSPAMLGQRRPEKSHTGVVTA